MKLESIGFYTLSDERCRNTSEHSQMMRGEIILTEYCNFRCPYCRGLDAKIYGDRKIKQLSLAEVQRIIDLWCQPLPLKNIRFSGGEPTLHKNIVEIVAYAKNKGVERIAISTNGSNKMELYRALVGAGVNDFSISLDACCADDGDKMAGGIHGAWEVVTNNIREISKLAYVTVGIVLTPENVQRTVDTVLLADKLGVADIRIISAAQWNKPLEGLSVIPQEVLDRHPILRYRVQNFSEGQNVRGMKETDSSHCAIVLDDSAIAGNLHFPCIIYMREKGDPIGMINDKMRQERLEWFKNHNCLEDPICSRNCLDVCRDYSNRYHEFHQTT